MLRELTEQERNHLFATANKVSQAMLKSSLHPLAVHLILMMAKPAHQTVPHVHLHILPRYKNDNFAFLRCSLLAKPLVMLTGGAKRRLLSGSKKLLKICNFLTMLRYKRGKETYQRGVP